MLTDDLSDDQSHRFAVSTCLVCRSPQREGPLLVTAQPAAVDGGGAGHGVQVVRAVGQRGNPLTVPLGLLFPGEQINTHSGAKMLVAPLQTNEHFCIVHQRSESASQERRPRAPCRLYLR